MSTIRQHSINSNATHGITAPVSENCQSLWLVPDNPLLHQAICNESLMWKSWSL